MCLNTCKKKYNNQVMGRQKAAGARLLDGSGLTSVRNLKGLKLVAMQRSQCP